MCFRKAQELPELAGTWVLNERLYAPENEFNENVAFTAVNTSGTIKEPTGVRIVKGSSSHSLELKPTTIVYYFSTNAWATGETNNKYNKWTIPAGATASDEFRAWLASNATKQA